MRYLTLIRVVLFVLTLVAWKWLLDHTLSPVLDAVCIVGTMLLVFPTVWAARKLLDREPTVERAAWVTTGVHAALMLFLGTAIIEGIQTGSAWRGWLIPVPSSVGLPLAYAMSALAVLTVVHHAWRALGSPFSLGMSRRLATDWMFRWTRNPMTLATVVWLVAVGLWLQSALFIAWSLFLMLPAWVAFLKIYEERELEIRFGDAYQAYKESTPFMWPGRRKGG